MKNIPLSECEICSRLPWSEWANLLNNESLPREVFRLKGMSGDGYPTGSTEKNVQCPLCGTWYHFSCETGCFEYDVGIRRLLPEEALQEKLITRRQFEDRNRVLERDIGLSDLNIRPYVARSLAGFYLMKGKKKELMKLAVDDDPNLRMQVVRALNKSEKIDAYIDLLIDFLYDENHHVRDAADSIYGLYNDETETILKYGEKLIEKIAAREMNYHTIQIMKKISLTCLERVNIAPVMGRLVEFFTMKTEYRYLYEDARRALKRAVAEKREYADIFLKEYGRFKRGKFKSSLEGVRKIAMKTTSAKT